MFMDKYQEGNMEVFELNTKVISGVTALNILISTRTRESSLSAINFWQRISL